MEDLEKLSHKFKFWKSEPATSLTHFKDEDSPESPIAQVVINKWNNAFDNAL